MSQENVKALRAVYEEWANGNFRAGVELYDEYVLYVPGTELPDVRPYYVGKAGIAEYMRAQLQAWASLTIAADEFIEATNSLVVAAHWRAVGHGSGTPTESRYFHVWTFRGRVVVRLELFGDRAEALEAVGLSE